MRQYARSQYPSEDLFAQEIRSAIDQVLDLLLLEQVFNGRQRDFEPWQQAKSDAELARVLWEAKTQQLKLSSFAEEFFRRLAARLGGQMLLTKGELHRLVAVVSTQSIDAEVLEKLELLADLFAASLDGEAASANQGP